MQEQKENSYLTEIRKKYEIEGQRYSKMERMESKINAEYNVDPLLRMAKSLSPPMKNKSNMGDIYKNTQTENHSLEIKESEEDFDDFLKIRNKKE